MLQSRAEAGCWESALHADLEREGDLCLYEVWADDTALRSHFAQPYTQEVGAQLQDWLAEPPMPTRLRRLE